MDIFICLLHPHRHTSLFIDLFKEVHTFLFIHTFYNQRGLFPLTSCIKHIIDFPFSYPSIELGNL